MKLVCKSFLCIFILFVLSCTDKMKLPEDIKDQFNSIDKNLLDSSEFIFYHHIHDCDKCIEYIYGKLEQNTGKRIAICVAGGSKYKLNQYVRVRIPSSFRSVIDTNQFIYTLARKRMILIDSNREMSYISTENLYKDVPKFFK